MNRDSSPLTGSRAEPIPQPHDLADCLSLLEDVDRRVTPEHVAARFQEILTGIGHGTASGAPDPRGRAGKSSAPVAHAGFGSAPRKHPELAGTGIPRHATGPAGVAELTEGSVPPANTARIRLSRSRVRLAAVVAAAAAVIALLALLLSPPSPGRPTPSPGAAQPVDVVILVDESGSVTASDLTAERQAVAAIVATAWSPQTQITVLGFGSAPPGSSEPSAAVSDLCPSTRLGSSGAVARLTRCAGKIAARPAGEDNTDYAAALAAAMSVLSSPAQQHRPGRVVLLTDGTLNLGSVPATNTAQQRLTSQILPDMRELGIQIWPLGFGQADMTELGLFARSAAQGSPSCPASVAGTPHATLVTATGAAEVEQVQDHLLTSFVSASCGAIKPDQKQTITPGGTPP